MILIENTCISDDVAEKMFVCDLNKCKGACCVEGDLGAPLEESELAILDNYNNASIVKSEIFLLLQERINIKNII